MASRAPLVLALAFLAIVILVPAAAGQVPASPAGNPCGTLTVTAGERELVFTPGERQVVSVTVAITGGNGVSADVSLNLTAPAGWTTGGPVRLTKVTATAQAATLDLTAPANLNPAARPQAASLVPSYACFAELPNARQQIQGPQAGEPVPLSLKARAAAAQTPFLDDTVLLALGAVAGVIALAGVVFLVARKRGPSGGIRLACDEAEKRVRPGRGTSYPVRVENRSAQPQAVRLEVTEVPEGWTAFLATQEVQLAVGESRVVWLLVRAPTVGLTEERVHVAVTAHGRHVSGERPVVRVLAIAEGVLEGKPAVDDETGVPL